MSYENRPQISATGLSPGGTINECLEGHPSPPNRDFLPGRIWGGGGVLRKSRKVQGKENLIVSYTRNFNKEIPKLDPMKIHKQMQMNPSVCTLYIQT